MSPLGDTYLSSIRKDLADLHEPEGISYAEALARLEERRSV